MYCHVSVMYIYIYSLGTGNYSLFSPKNSRFIGTWPHQGLGGWEPTNHRRIWNHAALGKSCYNWCGTTIGTEIEKKKQYTIIGFLRVPGCLRGGGVFLGNPEDSVWEDWGTLGKIKGITTAPNRILLQYNQFLDLGDSLVRGDD